jgi:hypothetical protein
LIDDIFYTMTPSQIKRANITRSKALAYGLSGHLGCWGASHRFSVAYDLATGSQTTIDKRWPRCFKGQVALTPKTIDKLATAFPAYPVQRIYRDGPGGLWQALWGELGAFSHGVLDDDLTSFGDFSRAMHEFEADALLMEAYGRLEPELSVAHLAKAVAYLRLQSGLFGLDPAGMVQIVNWCLCSRQVRAELAFFDVENEVTIALIPHTACLTTNPTERWDEIARLGAVGWVSPDACKPAFFSC